MLNEHQIDALQIVLNNSVIMSALLKVSSDMLAESLPDIENEDNSVVGEKYRAYKSSERLINSIFERLITYQKTQGEVKKISRHI